MLLTEEEAKTRYCHQSHRPPLGGGTPLFPCLGSGCMAWRVVSQHPGQLLLRPDKTPEDHGIEGNWEKTGAVHHDGDLFWEERLPAKGYCGLAGAPE